MSAEDAHRVRHYVYSKGGYLVAIVLHDTLRLLPYLDPERPETLRMNARMRTNLIVFVHNQSRAVLIPDYCPPLLPLVTSWFPMSLK